MSYRQSWSKLFFADEFEIESWTGYVAPDICPIPDHATFDPITGIKRASCFRARHAELQLATMGDFKLINPVDIALEMPGTLQKLLTVTYLGMHRGSYGSIGYTDYNNLRLFANDSEIFKRENLKHPHDSWTDPPGVISVNKSLEGKSSLSLRLHEHVVIGMFGEPKWVELHINQIKIDCEYYTDVAPERADVTVNVQNVETLKPISQARVTIKSGARIIADGYTNQGTVSFQNIIVGSYTLSIRASGYNVLEQSIAVEAPAVEYDVYLVPIPDPPLAWWVLPAAIGFVCIAGLMVLRRPSFPRYPPPPIMVMR